MLIEILDPFTSFYTFAIATIPKQHVSYRLIPINLYIIIMIIIRRQIIIFNNN